MRLYIKIAFTLACLILFAGWMFVTNLQAADAPAPKPTILTAQQKYDLRTLQAKGIVLGQQLQETQKQLEQLKADFAKAQKEACGDKATVDFGTAIDSDITCKPTDTKVQK